MRLSRSLSAYLDFLRFIAAFAVLLGHMDQDGLYMAWMPLAKFSHEAVIIFFVMSGYIIHSSTTAQGRSAAEYVVARASRVYSVALPAVLFSVVLSMFVIHQYAVTAQQLSNLSVVTVWDIASSLLFLNESWTNTVQLSLNGPFWSLCYEVWYYIIFGVFYFVSGRLRWPALLLCALVAGPAVMALFPIWVLGARLSSQRSVNIPISLAQAYAIFIGSVLLIIAIDLSDVDMTIQRALHEAVPGFWRLRSSQHLITDYVIGIAIVANIWVFPQLGSRVQNFFLRHSSTGKFLAGFSFTLYLFHRPLTQLAGFFAPNTSRSVIYSIAAALTILGICLLISYGTERQLGRWRNFMHRWASPLSVSGRHD